jgi:hypothetical protein
MNPVEIKYLADVTELKKALETLQNENKQLNATLDKSQQEVQDLGKKFESLENKGKKAFEETNKKGDILGKGMKKVGAAMAAAFALDKIMEFGGKVIEVTSNFQKFEAVLTNALGSKSAAQQGMAMILDFAARTPFSVQELTESYVKLVNRGFIPTVAQMTQLGDLASSTGKSFDQLTEAILDAQTGEFERLKEFGIRASKDGDVVTFAFKGVETQVDFTSEAINNYLLSLGEIQGVAGSMDAISKTLGGAISNLGDSWDQFLLALGESSSGLIMGVVQQLSAMLSVITDLISEEKLLSDQYKQDQLDLKMLEVEILNTNTTQAKRIELIKQLKNQYPDYLFNLDAEKATNEDIAKALDLVNKSLVDKIILQKQNEKLEEQATKVAEEKARLLEIERELIKEVAAAELRGNTYFPWVKTKELARQMPLLEKVSYYMKEHESMQEHFLKLYTDYVDTQKEVQKEEEKLNSAYNDRNKLMEQLVGNANKAIIPTEYYLNAMAEFDKKMAEEAANKRAEEAAKAAVAQEEALKKILQVQGIRVDIMEDGITKELAALDLKYIKERQAMKDNHQALLLLEQKYLIDRDEIVRKGAQKSITIQRKNGKADIKALEDKNKEQLEKDVESLNSGFKFKQENDERIKDSNEKRAQERIQLEADVFSSLNSLAYIFAQDAAQFAQFSKVLALFQIGIDTARAISSVVAAASATSITPIDLALKVAAGTATVLANIAQAKALIQGDAPVPGFKDGVIDLQGSGTSKSDSIAARLSRGESVMTSEETAKYKSELMAIRKNNFEELITTKYVLPAIKQVNKASNTGENMAAMTKLMAAMGSDAIVDAIYRNKPATSKDIAKLSKDISRTFKETAYVKSKMWKGGQA